MDESDLNQLDNTSITKTHEEILKMLEEIKEFEKKYGEFEPKEPIVEKVPTNLEYETFEEIKPELVFFKEVEEKKSKLFEKFKKFKTRFGKKVHREIPEIIEKPITPTTFRLRINEEGKLENIDLKKPKPRPKIKLSFRKKDKKESEESEKKSKFEKIKTVLSKMKRIIPKRKKEEEEPEESETSETTE